MTLITKAIFSQGIESGEKYTKINGEWRNLIPLCGDETVGISGAVSDL
jgi:hypothetical protein